MLAQRRASGACDDDAEDSDIEQMLRVSAARVGVLSHTQAALHRRASAACEDDAEDSDLEAALAWASGAGYKAATGKPLPVGLYMETEVEHFSTTDSCWVSAGLVDKHTGEGLRAVSETARRREQAAKEKGPRPGDDWSMKRHASTSQCCPLGTYRSAPSAGDLFDDSVDSDDTEPAYAGFPLLVGSRRLHTNSALVFSTLITEPLPGSTGL